MGLSLTFRQQMYGKNTIDAKFSEIFFLDTLPFISYTLIEPAKSWFVGKDKIIRHKNPNDIQTFFQILATIGLRYRISGASTKFFHLLPVGFPL